MVIRSGREYPNVRDDVDDASRVSDPFDPRARWQEV
jgi:hypothetical protein